MLDVRPLNSELNEIATTRLGEDAKKVPGMITTMRTWIRNHPYLRARTDDQFLIAFLRFCQYNLDDAKERLEYYYSYKTITAPELWRSRRIDDMLFSICRAGIFTTLPKTVGKGGPRVHVTQMGKIDCSMFTVQDLFRYHLFRSEIEINTDDNWVISGVLEILDLKKLPYGILRQYDGKLFRKMSAILEYGIPTNLIGTHVVNASREAQLVLMLARALMKEKQLLHIHTSVESLNKAIGKEYLPIEYGGVNGTLDEANEGYLATLDKFRRYFDDEEKFGVDENARKAALENKSENIS